MVLLFLAMDAELHRFGHPVQNPLVEVQHLELELQALGLKELFGRQQQEQLVKVVGH